MTKITKYEPKTYQGKINGYKVELSDGVSGNLSEKDSDKGLKAGDEVTYTITDYVSKRGNHSNLLTIKKAIGGTSTPPPSGSGVSLPNKTPLSVSTKIDHKVEAAIKAMEFCMDTFAREKFEWDVVISKQKEVVSTLWSEIDAIYAEK